MSDPGWREVSLQWNVNFFSKVNTPPMKMLPSKWWILLSHLCKAFTEIIDRDFFEVTTTVRNGANSVSENKFCYEITGIWSITGFELVDLESSVGIGTVCSCWFVWMIKALIFRSYDFEDEENCWFERTEKFEFYFDLFFEKTFLTTKIFLRFSLFQSFEFLFLRFEHFIELLNSKFEFSNTGTRGF